MQNNRDRVAANCIDLRVWVPVLPRRGKPGCQQEREWPVYVTRASQRAMIGTAITSATKRTTWCAAT